MVRNYTSPNQNQRKTKGQQLRGKIVSALFHTYWHFSKHSHTFAEFFRTFHPGLSLRIKGFSYRFSSKRLKRTKKIKRKGSPKRKFSGRISDVQADIRVRVLREKVSPHRLDRRIIELLRGRPRPEGKDVNDPRGSLKDFVQENFGLISRSLTLRF